MLKACEECWWSPCCNPPCGSPRSLIWDHASSRFKYYLCLMERENWHVLGQVSPVPFTYHAPFWLQVWFPVHQGTQGLTSGAGSLSLQSSSSRDRLNGRINGWIKWSFVWLWIQIKPNSLYKKKNQLSSLIFFFFAFVLLFTFWLDCSNRIIKFLRDRS